MASSASAEKRFYVTPDNSNPDMFDPELEYEGELFIDYMQDIKYGVTFNVAIEAIERFLKDHSEVLEEHGINMDMLFQ
jgi:hypothetical protein